MSEPTVPTTEESDAPFVAVFDTPPADELPATPEPVSTPLADEPAGSPFDPQQLVAEFKAKAAAEREEQERIERELQAKLVELTQVRRAQREHMQALAALEVTETEARHFPERLARLTTLIATLEPLLPALKDRGYALEQQAARTDQAISQLDQFLADLAAQQEAMVAEFGGGQLGQQRFDEVEQRTKRAGDQEQTTRTRTQELYHAWKRDVADTLQEAAKEVGLSFDPDALQSSELDLLADGIRTKNQALQALGANASAVIEQLDAVQRHIDTLLADQRITDRLNAEELAIDAAHAAFADCVVSLHGLTDKSPTEALLRRAADAFFDAAFDQVLTSDQRPQTAGATATGLSKSLTGALQKMKQQPAVDLVRLAAHIKAQLAMQQAKKPALTQAIRGYNDLLSFALLTGLAGDAKQAFEPLRIEHAQLGGTPEQAQRYVIQRAEPFVRVHELFLAAREARERVRNLQSPEPWPAWLATCCEAIMAAGLASAERTASNQYKELVGELSGLLSKHIGSQQKHAEQDAAQARQRLNELARTHLELTKEYEQSQTDLKDGLAALALVDDSMELVNDLDRLVGQQQGFGLLPLARGNPKQHEEIEQRSKLLLLKLPDLRRAAELVSLDLGQVDVTDPNKLKPQFQSFKLQLEQLVSQQRLEQTRRLEALRTLVDLFDQVILGDQAFDQAIRSPWLTKQASEELYGQYRTIEQNFRQAIQTYNLRQAGAPAF